jgi:transferase CAF17, mitochondrial
MSSSSSRAGTILAGNFGRLWKRGHESFAATTSSSHRRRILSVQGKGATTYLQGLVTCDLTQPPTPPREEEKEEVVDTTTTTTTEGDGTTNSSESENTVGVEFSDKLRAACFLDNRGRILTDTLLWKVDDTHYYIDVPEDTADTLISHLKQFILSRTKVDVKDESPSMVSHVVFGTLNAYGTPEGYMAAVDPRHPSLGMRVLSLDNNQNQFTKLMSKHFPEMPGTYHLIRTLAGVAEGMELQGKVAAEANQEFLNAVSFSKGCYLGQELTARVQYTGAVRKRIMPLFMVNVNMQIPRPWLMASQLQSKLMVEQGAKEEEMKEGEMKEEEIKEEDQVTMPTDMPRLPRLSAATAGSMVAMMSGSVPTEGSNYNTQTLSHLEEIQAQSNALFDQLQSYKAGDKIYNTKDGKTIGQIVATPAEGTNVLLAQMRLDSVGLLGNSTTWSHTNKVTIGDNPEGGATPLRYLPYLPLWWPSIDPETGKARSSTN